jgi:uncharacterized membrane protein YgaE (UPF0421/DUF939 family)
MEMAMNEKTLRTLLNSRILGAVIGIGTAYAVNLAIGRLGASLCLQLANAELLLRSFTKKGAI